MEINLQDMTIKFRGSEENIYELAQTISTKNIEEVIAILVEQNQGLPRILKTRALRLVLNDFVKVAKELPITTELLHRLNWYKEYSDYQLSKLFTTLSNSGDVRFHENELIGKYKCWLWVLVLSNANELKITGETLEKICDVADEYQAFEEYNNIINSALYDFSGSLDAVPQEDFLRVLFKSSTVAELREIAEKYEINVPKRLNRAQLLEVILQRLEEDGKNDEAVVAKVKDMKVVSLQRFAKDNDIKASTELRKDAVIDFILKAVENNQTNLKALPAVNLLVLPEEEFEMKPEFIREIDSRYFYEFDEDGEIVSMSDVEDLKNQIEELKAQQEEEKARFAILLAQREESTEEVTTTEEIIEEYDMDPLTLRMQELERQIEILNENQKRENETSEVDQLKVRELELLKELEEAKQNDSTERAEALERELEEIKNRQEEITITEEVVVTTEEVIIEEDNEEAIRLAQELEEARIREEEALTREEEARIREEEALAREEELLKELELARIANTIVQNEIVEETETDEEPEFTLFDEENQVENNEEIYTEEVIVTTEEVIIEEDNEEAIRLAQELEEARIREEELKAREEELKAREEELLRELELARLSNSVEQEEILMRQLEDVKTEQEEITVTEVVVTTEEVIIEEDNEEAIRLAQELEEARIREEEFRAREEELLRELEEKDKELEEAFNDEPSLDDMNFEDINLVETTSTVVITEEETVIEEEFEDIEEFIPEDIEFDDVSIEDIDLMEDIDPSTLEEPTVIEETIEQHEIYGIDDSTLNKKQLKAKKEVQKLLKKKEKLERYKRMKDSKLVKRHRAKRRLKIFLGFLFFLFLVALYIFVVVAGIYRVENNITSPISFWGIDPLSKFGDVNISVLDSISFGNYDNIYNFVVKAYDWIMQLFGM